MPYTIDYIRTLAAATGLEIPEERLPLVLKEYESLLRTVAEIDSLPLPREAEPAAIVTLAPPQAAAPQERKR
jgi:hypothetical protein